MWFQYVTTSNNPGEGMCKDGNKANDSNIANAKPIDTVKVIHKPEVNRMLQMERQKNVKCTEAKRPEPDWAGEAKFDEIYDYYKDEFLENLSEFKDRWDEYECRVNAVGHQMDLTTPDVGLTNSALYCARPSGNGLERDKIENSLKMHVIEPSQTEWAAPILFVRKKNTSLRFCFDYRKLNALIVSYAYRLPIMPMMNKWIDSHGGALILSKFDWNSGYSQIEMHEEDQEKTECTAHRCGLFHLIHIPYGLKIAPGTLECVIDITLATVKW